MSRIVVLLLGFCFWAADRVCAQATDSLTISGTVLEIGSDGKASLPVPGAEVSLIEFLRADDGSTARSPVATAYSDSQGTYQFQPLHAGSYYVEVKKEGYRYSAPQFCGIAVKLDQSHTAQRAAFTLIRPGSITGRVVDAGGEPVPDVKAVVTSARSMAPNIALARLSHR
jgi:hypothetical protein